MVSTRRTAASWSATLALFVRGLAFYLVAAVVPRDLHQSKAGKGDGMGRRRSTHKVIYDLYMKNSRL